MNEIIVKPGVEISLGKRGENLARCAVFDISAWEKTYGDGTAHLLHQRNGDSAPYPCVIEVDGGKVCWPITEIDVAVAGTGRAELQYFVGETRVKSVTWQTRTERGLNNAGATPEPPGENWIDTLLGLGTETQENAQAAQMSAQRAQESAQAAANSSRAAAVSSSNAKAYEAMALSYLEDAKTQASFAEAAADEATVALRAAEEAKTSAAQSAGSARASEESAVVLSSSAGDSAAAAETARAAAEAAVGKTSYIGSNGNWYEWDRSAGAFVDSGVKAQGPSGDDGVSPVITTSIITGGTRVTIKDASGTSTFDVMNGKDGASGSGTGDMTAAMYDPQGRRMDIFDYVDQVEGRFDSHNLSTDAHPLIQKRLETVETTVQNDCVKVDYFSSEIGGRFDLHNEDNAAHANILGKKVSKTGDTMTGDLTLQPNSGQGYSLLKKNAGSGYDYGLQLQDNGADGSFMGLTISAKSQKLEFKKKAAGETEYTYPEIYSSDNPPGPTDVNAVPIWGGTMTGALTLSGDPYSAKHAATKQYVDAVENKIYTHGPDYDEFSAALTDLEGNITAVRDELTSHNTDTEAHADIRELVYTHGPNYEEWSTVLTDFDGMISEKMPMSGGTFTGTAKAGSSYQAPGTSLLRNSKLVAADTNPTVNGEINWTYG